MARRMLKAPPANPRDNISWTSKISPRDVNMFLNMFEKALKIERAGVLCFNGLLYSK